MSNTGLSFDKTSQAYTILMLGCKGSPAPIAYLYAPTLIKTPWAWGDPLVNSTQWQLLSPHPGGLRPVWGPHPGDPVTLSVPDPLLSWLLTSENLVAMRTWLLMVPPKVPVQHLSW